MQRLLDVVADIPGLLEAGDRLSSQNSSACGDEEQSLGILILRVLRQLVEWRTEWGNTFSSAAYPVSVASTTHLEHLHLPLECAARSIWYSQFERAHEIVIYDGALLLLLQLAEIWNDRTSVENVFASLRLPLGPKAISQPLIMPTGGLIADHVIDEIYCSVSYLLAPQHGRSGVVALYYPLRCW